MGKFLLYLTVQEMMSSTSEDEKIFYQQEGAPTHYHLAVRAFLDDNLRGHWIGRRVPPRSLDLTPMDFYFWETVKYQFYRRKLRTLEELRLEVTAASAAISIETLTEITAATTRRSVWCLAANVYQMEFVNCLNSGHDLKVSTLNVVCGTRDGRMNSIDKVYRPPMSANLAQLRNRITAAVQEVTPDMLQRV
ncbi:hypothetical protein C0J52_04347 [Blattella germanica]|nr:hypothetical protein C0J52_04347 [Blattella germanica]